MVWPGSRGIGPVSAVMCRSNRSVGLVYRSCRVVVVSYHRYCTVIFREEWAQKFEKVKYPGLLHVAGLLHGREFVGSQRHARHPLPWWAGLSRPTRGRAGSLSTETLNLEVLSSPDI